MIEDTSAEDLLASLEEILIKAEEFSECTGEWGPRLAVTLAIIDLKKHIEKNSILS